MRTLPACLLLLFTCVRSPAQNLKPADPQTLFANGDYSQALPLFLKELRTDSTNVMLNYRIGLCYLSSRSQKQRAVPFLETAAANTEKQNVTSLAADIYRMLGDAYSRSYEFDKAIQNYERSEAIIREKTPADVRLQEISNRIGVCKTGQKLKGLSRPLALDHGSKTLTTTFYFKDSLLPSKATTITDTVKKEKNNPNEATIATSYDGQIILSYHDEEGRAQLYTTFLTNNSWTVPEKVNRAINPSGWEPDECISADGSVLFFTSDRKEGYGGKDIYMCRKAPDGEWGSAVNLGPEINTPFDEEAPFIHPDGVTLYYSSNGMQKDGRFGIYSAWLDNGHWTKNKSVGFPIDSTRALVPEKKETAVKTEVPKKKRRRKDQEVTAPQEETRDNYLISFNNPMGGAPLTLLNGEVKTTTGEKPGKVTISMRNNQTQTTVARYVSDSVSGKFAILLPPGMNTNISYNRINYLSSTDNIDLTQARDLFEKKPPVVLMAPEEKNELVLRNVFFKKDSAALMPASSLVLNDLYSFLVVHPEVTVEFNNTLVVKENRRQNERLAQQRAETIMNYMVTKGIPKERVSAKGNSLKMKHAPAENQEILAMKIIGCLPGKELLTNQ